MRSRGREREHFFWSLRSPPYQGISISLEDLIRATGCLPQPRGKAEHEETQKKEPLTPTPFRGNWPSWLSLCMALNFAAGFLPALIPIYPNRAPSVKVPEPPSGPPKCANPRSWPLASPGSCDSVRPKSGQGNRIV
jgi:hypothetical protein